MSHSITDSTVLLGHGSGGQMMKRIIDEVFLDAFGSPELLEGNDAGVAALLASGRIAMSTDSFVVSPQFFPGGNIGRLAVCGTVNDVATSGANVRYLSCGFILEEGYPMDKLRQIVQTMAETAREAGVSIITGDTKAVSYTHLDVYKRQHRVQPRIVWGSSVVQILLRPLCAQLHKKTGTSLCDPHPFTGGCL